MIFGVFDLINIEKGRTRGSGNTKYVAIYEVSTRSGSKYLKYFYQKDVATSGTWLAMQQKKGNSVVRLDLVTGKPYVAEKKELVPPTKTRPDRADLVARKPDAVVSTAQVAEKRAHHENDIRYTYVRLGDKLRSLDKVGYDATKKLLELGARRDELREKIGNTVAKLAEHPDSESLLELKVDLETEFDRVSKDHAVLFEQVNKRPLATKMLRVVNVQNKIAAVQKEFEQALKDDPEKAKQQMAARLWELKWKLRGTKGDAIAIPKKAPKLGVKERLFVTTSADIEGLNPNDTPISYALTAGWGEQLPASGRNWMTRGQKAALFKEFAADIRNIARGRAYGSNVPGWASVVNIKGLGEDIESELHLKLIDLSETYSKELAESGRSRGSNFRAYALSMLKQTAQNAVRTAVAEAIHMGKMEPESLHEIGPALAWNEEGALTRDQLREHTDVMGAPYVTPEDMVAISDVKRLVETRLSPTIAVALMSRLNLHNPQDLPTGGSGLKDWTSVAKDVHETLKGSDDVPSVAYIKGSLTKQLSSLTRVAGDGWAAGLRPSEKEGLKEGIKALIRVSAFSRASVPGTSAWERTHEPTKAGKHKHAKPGQTVPQPLHVRISGRADLPPPVTGHSAPQRPLVIGKVGVKEARDFWAAQARNVAGTSVTTNRAPHFNPAAQLDLGMDVVAPTGAAITPQLKLKQLRAVHLAKVWQKLSKLGTWRLAALSAQPEFIKFKEDHLRAQQAAFVEHDKAVQEMEGSLKKKTRVDAALVITKKNGKSVSISGVSPDVVERMARLIRQQREMDGKVIKKPVPLLVKALANKLKLSADLVKVLNLLRRVLRLTNGR